MSFEPITEHKQVFEALALAVDARLTCIKRDNNEWRDIHKETIHTIVKRYMPSGSGFDSGTKIDLDKSTGDKLVFNTSFHHMNEHGYYGRWTYHTVVVKPSFIGLFDLNIGGPNYNDIKELIAQSFDIALKERVASEDYARPDRENSA
jgi:hypothetical protein